MNTNIYHSDDGMLDNNNSILITKVLLFINVKLFVEYSIKSKHYKQ